MRVRQNRRGAAIAILALAALTGAPGCSVLKKAPGISMMFPDDGPQAPQDPTSQAGVDYEIMVFGLGEGETSDETVENERIQGIIEDNARVYKLQDKPPPSLPLLRRRAAADEDLVVRALKSEGYYEGEAEIVVKSGAEPEPLSEEDALASADEPEKEKTAEPEITPPENAGPPVVEIRVRKGPRYAIARQQVIIKPEVSPTLRERVDIAAASYVGLPGRGANVVDGEQAALGALNRSGRPYAAKGKRRAEANFDHDALDVVTPLDPGPHTVFGTTTISGNTQVETDYIEGFVDWTPGETLSRGRLRDVQRELVSTRLFNAASVTIPDAPPEDLKTGETFEAPVEITLEESKHRSVSAGLSYSTTDGPGATASWEHRNFYGRNEQVRAALDISQKAQEITADFKKPRFMKPTRDLVGGLRIYHEELDAYDATGATGSIGIEEEFNRYLSGTLGVAFDVAQVTENGLTKESYLLGLPGSLAFDDTDDLLDPTEGSRVRLSLAPWGGIFDDEASYFLINDLNASTYIPFDKRNRYVFALRGRGAIIVADNRNRVPPQRRLYSGGGGSVRGFANQFVGPLDAQNDPLGGLTVAELSAEMRMRFGSFGVVPFVDAGLVGADFLADYDKVRWGAGLGARYYSPVGPIRVDVAVPINKRDGVDDDFQLYFSIGQAF